MPEFRFVPCETCGGSGNIERRHPQWGNASCPEPWIAVPCEACMGHGDIAVEVQPITLEDLEKAAPASGN